MKSSCSAILALLLATIGGLHAESFSTEFTALRPALKISLSGDWSVYQGKMTIKIAGGSITRTKPIDLGRNDPQNSVVPIHLTAMTVSLVASPGNYPSSSGYPGGAGESRFPRPSGMYPGGVSPAALPGSLVQSKPSNISAYLAEGETFPIQPATVEIDTRSFYSPSSDTVSLGLILQPETGNPITATSKTYLSGQPIAPSRPGPGGPGSAIDPPSPPFTATGVANPLNFEPNRTFKRTGILNWSGTFETFPDKVRIRLTEGSIKRPSADEVAALGDAREFQTRSTPRTNSGFSPTIPMPPNGALIYLAVRRIENGYHAMVARGEPISIERYVAGEPVSLIAFNYDLPIAVTEFQAKNCFVALILETPESNYTLSAESQLFLDGSPRPARPSGSSTGGGMGGSNPGSTPTAPGWGGSVVPGVPPPAGR